MLPPKQTPGEMKNFPIVSVVIASHNRQASTRSSIESLNKSAKDIWECQFVVVDDGSSDGTLTMLESMELKMNVISGDGSWFWAKSMSVGMNSIPSNTEYVLLLNDDVVVHDSAVKTVEVYRNRHTNTILVGQLCDQEKNFITYGGLRRIGRHPFRTALVHARDDVNSADTFHGNFVLVPITVIKEIGSIDGSYAHAYADFDYGYRAKKHDIDILVIPNFVGTCESNSNSYGSPRNLIEFLKIFSRKERPLMSQIRFAFRHGGVEWPIYVLSGYIVPLFRILIKLPLRKSPRRGNT